MLARAAVLVVTAAVAAGAAQAAAPPRVSAFAGAWVGHTRFLTIARGGTATESVGDGCCDPIVDLTLRLSRPRRTARGLVATVVVTAVRVHDRSAFSRAHPAPRLRQQGVVRVRGGILTETVTGQIYCGRDARPGACGA